MSANIIREWHFWLASIAAGACMAFAYDLLRLFRRLVRHGRFAVDLEDILYWAACFVASFSLLYYGNNGVIRFAAVFGAAAGMFAYVVTLGRFFVKCSFFVIDRTAGNLLRFCCKVVRTVRSRIVLRARKFAGRLGRMKKSMKKNPDLRKKRLTKRRFHHRM